MIFRWVLARLTPLVTLTFAAFLLVAGIILVLAAARSSQARHIDQGIVQARILASTVTAALAFKDRDAAREYVNALAEDPQILVAAVYDVSGELFVSYARSDYPVPGQIPRVMKFAVDPDRLVMTVPVTQSGIALGTVYIQVSADSLGMIARRYGLVALIATLAALVVAVVGFAQSELTRANKELERRAWDLAEAIGNLRAQIAEREKVEAALRQAQKMEAIGQLTGGVAHDFNNLLQVIISNLDALVRLQPAADMAEIRRLADAAIGGAQRGASLTRQLLAFGRRQPLAPRPFDVNFLVAELSDLLHRTLGESIIIDTVLDDDLWWASADAHQLESALLNLAVNARDAMPNGGRLTIETGRIHFDPSGDASDEPRAGDYVQIAVADTGTGMTQAVLARAFEPFFTTKGVGEGSGLGLAQVYGYVKQSGGHVKVQSGPSEGTTVTLYLPRAGDGLDAAATRSKLTPVKREPDTETVLVVEDEKIVLFAAVQSLKSVGYRVLSAENAAAALDIINGTELIDILFSDVVMPGNLNGVELAFAASQVRPNLKVLLTSGYNPVALSAQHGLGEGVALLQKPYRTEELVAKLRMMLRVA